MDGSPYRDLIGAESEAAMQRSCPEVQLLLDVGNVRRTGRSIAFRQLQSNLSQVQSMWVLTQPVEKFCLTFGARMITNRPAMCIVWGQAKCLWIKAAGQGSRVPSPLRHRAQRHRLFVFRGDGL